MKTQQRSSLKSLTPEEIQCVSGSGAGPRRELKAEDAYGNKLSIEEWENRRMMAFRSGDANYIWDFNYDPHI